MSRIGISASPFRQRLNPLGNLVRYVCPRMPSLSSCRSISRNSRVSTTSRAQCPSANVINGFSLKLCATTRPQYTSVYSLHSQLLVFSAAKDPSQASSNKILLYIDYTPRSKQIELQMQLKVHAEVYHATMPGNPVRQMLVTARCDGFCGESTCSSSETFPMPSFSSAP